MATRKPAPKTEIRTEATVLPPALPDAEIQAAFDELLALYRGATLDYAVRSGELIVRRFFGGSMAAWRERSTSDASLRKLVGRIEVSGHPGLSAASLYRAVEIYDLDRRVGIRGRPQLNAGHARAVIGLAEKQQEQLLGRAEAQDWTAERLEIEVARLRDRSSRGRPALPRFLKAMRAFHRLAVDDDAFADLGRIGEISDADARALADAVMKTRARCEAVLAALGHRRSR